MIGTPSEQAEGVFDRAVGVSLNGAFRLAHALGRLLVAPGGRIINLGSAVAQKAALRFQATPRTPAKAGLHGLTLALARVNLHRVA